MDEETRAELLGIFRDELADRREDIETRRAILRRADAGEAEVRTAIDDIYRAAHTLKGAAQAIGNAVVASTCHTLEDALAGVRRSEPLALDSALRAVDQALAGLREPTPAPTSASPRGEAAPAPVEPAAPAPPSGTVRVDLASVRVLGQMVQELTTMLGTLDDEPESREIATIAARLADRLRQTRRMLARSPELAAAHESLAEILEALGGLRRALTLRRLRRDQLHVAAEQRLQRLDEVTRQLRLTSARTLRLALEQSAREAAREVGKEIEFECTGEDVSVDREVIDRVREPLMHIVRNAVDHGIEVPQRRRELGKSEAGRVRLTIRADGAEVVFTVADDGAGFDLEALAHSAGDRDSADGSLERAFAAGVSTRDRATSTSGRGMGLSIVRESVSMLHGSTDVRSRPGRGATVELRVPVRLNAVEGLVAVIDDVELTIPTTAVDRIVRPHAAQVRVIEGGTWIAQPGADLLPAVHLPSGHGRALLPREHALAIVLGRGRRRVALWVDEIRELRSVLVRPLGPRAVGSPYVRAATIQPDGLVGLVLDVGAVMREARPASARPREHAAGVAPARLLVVDDSITTRQLVRVVLESAGYAVTVAEDGEAAWRRLREEGRFDLVVSDIDMPHLDGLGLLARIRATAALRDIPVVLVTALEQEDDRRRALDMGADAYVGKSSFDQVSLLDRIRDLLA